LPTMRVDATQRANRGACTRSSEGPHVKHAHGIPWDGENTKFRVSAEKRRSSESYEIPCRREDAETPKTRNSVCRQKDAEDSKIWNSVCWRKYEIPCFHGKTPKHRTSGTLRLVRRHREFNPSGRRPETSTSVRTERIEDQYRIGYWSRCLVQRGGQADPNDELESEEATAVTQTRRGAKRHRSRKPEEPQVELEGEC
jgi:hypothetical protein